MASGGNLPQLCVNLPSIHDIQLKAEQPELPVDILLLTVEDFEFLACYQQLKDPFRCWFDAFGHVYFENVRKVQGERLKVALMKCCSGGSGPGGSLITVKNAAKVLRPKAVISVGTCCGLNSKKTKLGDVVVSSKLRKCASKEVTEHQAQSSGNCHVSRRFNDVIKNFADGWKAPLKNSEAQEVKVHLGELLSGPEVVRHELQCKELAELYPEAVAFEMEGEGILVAAFDLQIEWLIVKGISHFGDSAQLNEESWQVFASGMAASLVAHILSDPCVFRSWPHFEEPSSELLAEFSSILEESGEQLVAIIRDLEWQDTEKRMEGLSNLKDRDLPAVDDINQSEKNFKTLVQRVWNSSKHWSDCQSEFIVFTCQGNGDFNLMNCLAILSWFAFVKIATKSLEVIQTLAGQYKHHPGFGVVINNLGVMFCEKALFENSAECFVMAKSCFDLQGDHLRVAAVSLNQAVLYKTIGDYKKAQSLCSEIAAVYCHKFEIKEKNVHLLVKVLIRSADMLKELEDYVMFYKFLRICAHFDFAGASLPISLVLAGQLIKLQLKEETSRNAIAKEVTYFSHDLLMLLDNPNAELMNTDIIRVMINVAKIHRKNGYPDEACNLLKKLQNAFLFVHGGKTSLYGSLLYQIGCFFIASEKFSDALIALRQAVNILMSYFGQEHYAVASCMSMLGSCFLLMGNYKEALKYLNEALVKFTNLNPNHPEVGKILQALSFLKIEEKYFQHACGTMKEASDIFVSACGELSPMTATGCFQSAMFLLKENSLWNFARKKLVTAIDIFLCLGLKPHHSIVIACRSLLGVLQLSLRDREEAEKSFEGVKQQLDINGESWIKSRIIYSPLVHLLAPSLAVDIDRSFDLCAKVVALVNLVHLKTGDERYRHLALLINYLEAHKTEELQIKDFAGQDVFHILHRLPVFDKPVVCILSSHPKPASSESGEQMGNHPVSDTKEPDEQREGSQMFLSAVNNKYFVLCLRVPHNIQEDISFLASALQKSVLTLFLQPSFCKDFVERDDLYKEMTIPTLNICFLRRLIDCLPLLVELELSHLQECGNFDYLNSWESSLKSTKQSIQVSYLSSECSNQREAIFVFDRLTQRLHEKLTLSTDLGVVVSHVSPARNVASLVIEKLGKSFISIAVEKKFLIVKCCSFKDSDLERVCSLVQEALESTMESSAFSVNLEQSSWFRGQGSCCELSRENCSSDVSSGLFCSDSTLERSDSPCADIRDPQSVLKMHTVDVLQGMDVEIRPIVSHTSSNLPTDVDINLCLLEYLLRQVKCEATTEKTLQSSNVTSSSDSCASDVEVNQNSPVSSEQTPVSENNYSFPESDDSFTPTKSLPDSLSSLRSIKESNGHLSLDQSDSEVSSYRHLSNEEGIVKSSCDPDTREAKQLEDLHQLQSSIAECNSVSSEENSIFPVDQKTGAQDVHTNTESNVANSSLLLLNNQAGHLDLYQSQKQGPSVERHESISRPSSAASSEGSGLETASGDFENVFAASRKKCFELQLEIKQLEEQLKQSEEEKQKLQVDLGKHLFLEEKGKRCGRLLGGAALLHESGFSLHSRLLEISDSLSWEEVKKIKFLVKSKVNGFRLARITEAFELFEELETNGVFPYHYISNLLAGIQRYDLVEKLGIQLPLTAAKHGSGILSGQSLSASGNRLPDHVENSPKLTSVKDYSLEVQLNRHGRKHLVGNGVFTRVSIRGDPMQLQGVEENDKSFTTEEAEIEQDNNSSLGFSENSRETNMYTAVSSESEKSSNSSMKSALSAEEFPQFPTLTSDGYLSTSNDSSLLSSSFEQTAVVADSSCTLQSSIDTTDGSPILTTLSSKACRNKEISVDTDPNIACTKEQTERSSKFHCADVECDGSPIVLSCQSYSAYSSSENNECYVANGEDELFDKATEKSEWKEIEEEKDFVDSCDGAIRTVHSGTSADTGTGSSDSFVGQIVGTQSVASGENLPLTQQGTSSTAERVLRTQSSAETDWERLGARPKEVQRSDVQPKPTEPVVYITDGLAGDFLARHTQDKSLHDSIYQTDGASLFNDFPSQGTSFIDGDVSQSSRAQAYFGDCQVASRAEPFIGTGNSLVSGSNRHLGGSSNAELFSDNSGLWPSRVGNDLFSLHSSYLSRNTSTTANNYSLQSDFVHSSHRFAGVDHFDGQTYLPSAQQMPYPPMASDPVLNSYPGMTGSSSLADPSQTGLALTLPGDPVHNAQRFSSFSSEQLTDPAHDADRFAGDDNSSAFISNQGTDEPAQKTNLAPGNSRTTGNVDDSANSAARYQLDNSTSFTSVLSARSTRDTSVLEPRHDDADNNRVSVLNNTDFGTDSIEASDNSLLALERRVAEACALVERVLREREEREQFGREIERKEQLIREQRARERREREERELREAENWPQQQEAINARSQWLCEHYQRHCRVRFPCCTQFYPCHRCHNISKACDNEEAKACHATHLKCSHCQHEQEIGEDSAKCRKCGGKMSAYFCAICKHFTSVDKNPYHCEKCGICRIHQDKSFHCEVCNVCLDKRLEGNHKCRPDSGHDECCICLEDAFSGCQILPCSHKVHRECAIAMIQNGIRTCPICRHPLYSQSRE